VSLWTTPDKKSHHIPLANLALADGMAAALDEAGKDVYFGVGLRKTDLPPHQRGTKEDVLLVPGLWLDIDIVGEGHAATEGLKALEEVEAALRGFPLPPSIQVHSGGGVHVYYLFDHPLQLDDQRTVREFEEYNRRLQKSLHSDDVSDVTRILRVPDTTNRKLADPKLARAYHEKLTAHMRRA
jgi:putative DNA primase/helicase